MQETILKISKKYLLPLTCFFFIAVSNAQIVKVETDSVIVYCKYHDLIHEIKKKKYWGSITYWEPRKCLFVSYKKKIVERDPPSYLDSMRVLKKSTNDTIVVSQSLWYDEMNNETESLVQKQKLRFFDKRSNKKVAHVKKIVKGQKGQILYYAYLDKETKNELYIIVKETWLE